MGNGSWSNRNQRILQEVRPWLPDTNPHNRVSAGVQMFTGGSGLLSDADFVKCVACLFREARKRMKRGVPINIAWIPPGKPSHSDPFGVCGYILIWLSNGPGDRSVPSKSYDHQRMNMMLQWWYRPRRMFRKRHWYAAPAHNNKTSDSTWVQGLLYG